MPKTLVLIVASDAERHLDELLYRPLAERLRDQELHVLVIDDASRHGPAAAGARSRREPGAIVPTVIRSPVSQGWGGNQKLGYRYALDGGFDLVILLPGDGRQTVESIPTFVEAFERTGADVLLGSRRGKSGSTGRDDERRHGPAGSRLLTGLQNMITGRRLSEYGGGCRAYSCSFLRSVPFEIDTNERHFDTEILLQAFTVGARIEELDLPIRQASEEGRAIGVRYAAAALSSTIVYRMHHLGMLCSLKHRDLRAERYRSKVWIPYSSHSKALEVVRRSAPASILDVGCGPGHLAERCEQMGARVTGVDREKPRPGAMSEFHLWDVERTPLPLDALAFDMVLMLDLIEHLANPEEFLLSLRNSSDLAIADPRTQVVLTTPNVAFFAVRLNLLLGRFNYAERGILDITHKRLFTRRALLATLEDCGYRVERLEGISVPFEAVFASRWARFLGAASELLARLWPSLFAFQFLVVCRPRPGVRQLLRASELDPDDGA